jgi:hypothetical protein
MVRVHSVSIADASDFIEIGIAADGYTPESPDTDFQVSGGLATVTLGSTASAPSYHYVSAGSAFGPLVRIAVTGTRGGASSTSDLEADLSLALSMKAPGQGR